VLGGLHHEYRLVKGAMTPRWSNSAVALAHVSPARSSNPIARAEHEHESAGRVLAQMRHLTLDYYIPEEACNTHRALFAALIELEADLHQHIHLENNILFPRAAAAGSVDSSSPTNRSYSLREGKHRRGLYIPTIDTQGEKTVFLHPYI
jgi:hypothetical protein